VQSARVLKEERGSAVVQSVFAVVALVFLVLGVVQVAFSLYARNVVASSAHEGARAAIEFGRDPSEALAIAGDTVESAAGGLVDDLDVGVVSREVGDQRLVTVVVTGRLAQFGPVPFPMELTSRATAAREGVPE
jgi:hypothetical protein